MVKTTSKVIPILLSALMLVSCGRLSKSSAGDTEDAVNPKNVVNAYLDAIDKADTEKLLGCFEKSAQDAILEKYDEDRLKEQLKYAGGVMEEQKGAEWRKNTKVADYNRVKIENGITCYNVTVDFEEGEEIYSVIKVKLHYYMDMSVFTGLESMFPGPETTEGNSVSPTPQPSDTPAEPGSDVTSDQLYPRTDLTRDDMSELTFYKGGEHLFTSQRGESPDKWSITYPVALEADYYGLDKFLAGLSSLKVNSIVENNPSDLKIYGLDNPQYMFMYTLDGKQHVLMIGNSTNSQYYAMLEGRDAVFTLDSSNLSFVDTPLIEIVDRLIYLPAIYDVSKLVIDIDGRTDILEMDLNKDNPGNDLYVFNGTKITDSATQKLFRYYYQGAIAIMGDKLDMNANPEGKPFARFTYTFKTGEITVVELIPTPDGYGYYAVKNNEYTGLVVTGSQLDNEEFGIRSAYKNLVNELDGQN